MTNKELSIEFDVQVNAYLNSINIGYEDRFAFDEYEKSVFLTQTLEESVVSFYNGKNPFGESFESKEEIREYLKVFIDTYKYEDFHYTSPNETHIDESTVFVPIPDNVWFITYESVDLKDNRLNCNGERKNVPITPVTQDEFSKVIRNPFRGSNERRVLRLDSNTNEVELYSKYNISKYLLRYLRKPNPIILEGAAANPTVSLNGIGSVSDCELHEALHRPLVKLAAQKAVMTRNINMPNGK